jgi:hypothetical protein
MTRPLRRTLLLVAFSLLASAATAYAECSWVLGSKEVVSKSVRWSIERAAGTEVECKTNCRGLDSKDATRPRLPMGSAGLA